MRKLLLTMAAAVALLFTACDKDKDQEQTTAEAEFEFKINQTDFNFKSEVPECLDLDLDYVKFVIDGTTYITDIYTVEGEMLTEVIKFAPGPHVLTSFLVYNDNGTPNDDTDDQLVKAAPSPNSEYYDLMTYPLDLTFDVDAFYKKQISVDVLCFEDFAYESFGFSWFQFNDIKIEKLYFFGDICTGCYDDYAGSLYADQVSGVQMDMPAIFEIHVSKKNEDGNYELIREFDNVLNADGTNWLGEGAPLSIYWPNDLGKTEEFKIDLLVLLPSGDSFDYQLINTWEFTDENGPEETATVTDNVIDFVVGSCQYQNSDYNFPYWLNLPDGEFTMVTGGSSPGSLGTYFDVTFSGIGDGYNLSNGTYGVYCGDKNNTINLGSTFNNTTAYNSLSTTLPDDFPLTSEETVLVNYFFNNIGDYIDGWDYDNPTDYAIVQDVIWGITDADTFTPSGQALTILNQVMVNGAGYVVPPGGYAGIIIWEAGADPAIQMIFTVIDPCL